MFPLRALTVTDAEVDGKVVGDKVAEGVEITLVANGTTEDMPDDGSCVITEPLVEGKGADGTRETEITEEATWIEDVVKTIVDAEFVSAAALVDVVELVP